MTHAEALENEKEGSDGKAKGHKAEVAKKRAVDAAILGVFIHKGSLEGAGEEWDEKRKALVNKLEKKYKVGTSIDEVRVKGYFLVEGWALASNTGSGLEETQHWSQLVVGQVLTATVSKIHDFGLVLKYGDNVKGTCPMIHTSDTGASSNLHKMFKVGQKLQVKVWEVSQGAIIFTAKKSFVNDTSNSILSSYDDAKIGSNVLGIISSISPIGIRVHFSNGVKGLIPTNILVKQGVTDPSDSYRLGQVIKTFLVRILPANEYKGKKRILASKMPKPKIHLALDIGDKKKIMKFVEEEDEKMAAAKAKEDGDKDENSDSDKEDDDDDDDNDNDDDDDEGNTKQKKSTSPSKEEKFRASPAEFVSGSVTKIEEDHLVVTTDSGHVGHLPKSHCFDFVSTATKAFAKSSRIFSVGSRISNALILSSSKGTMQLTLKPLLLSAARSSSSSAANKASKSSSSSSLQTTSEDVLIPSKIAEMSPGQLLAGYVFKVESFGVIIRFRDSLTALAPRPNIGDKFISTPVGLFNPGDSVHCIVQRVELARDRAILSLKPLIVPASLGDHCYLNSLLKERALINVKKDLESYPLGSVVNAVVTNIPDYGVVLIAPDQTTMLLARGVHAEASKVKVGSSVTVRILDIDYENSVLDVTMLKELVSAAQDADADGDASSNSKKKSSKKNSKSTKSNTENASESQISEGSSVSARVEMVKDKYLVVSFNQGRSLAYSMVADFHTPYLLCDAFSVHQEITCRVIKCPSSSMSSSQSTSEHPHSVAYIVSSQQENEVQREQAAKIQKEAEEADKKLRNRLQSNEDESSTKKDASKSTSDSENFIDSVRVGSVIACVVASVSPTELTVFPESLSKDNAQLDHLRAVVHLSGAIDQVDGCDDLEKTLENAKGCDRNSIHKHHPFYGMKSGQQIMCRVLQVRKNVPNNNANATETQSGSKKSQVKKEPETVNLVYLSLEDNKGKGSKRNGKNTPANQLLQWTGKNSVKVNCLYAGVITNVGPVSCTVSFSPYVKSTLSYLDVSTEASTVRKFAKGCFVGQRIVTMISRLEMNGNKNSIHINRAVAETLVSGGSSVDLSTSREVSEDVIENYPR